MEELLNKTLWHNPLKAYLLAVAIFTTSLVLAWIVARLLRRHVIARASETTNRLDDLVAGVGVRPVALILVLAGLHMALSSLLLPFWLRRSLWTALVVSWTVVGALFVMRVINGLLLHYVSRYAEASEEALYIQLTQTVRSTVNVAIWIIAAIFIVSNLGFNVSSVLAGLGLGGLALALAAKDTLANVFGSFTILLNGPFRVGDWVTYQGHTGKVELVGLRDTRIRTGDGHLVVVPNAKAPTSVVENISRRPSLRCHFPLRLRLDTPKEQLDALPELVKAAIAEEPDVSEDQRVHFLAFGPQALELQVTYYILDPSRALDIRHGVNSRIQDALQRAGVRLAPPAVVADSP